MQYKYYTLFVLTILLKPKVPFSGSQLYNTSHQFTTKKGIKSCYLLSKLGQILKKNIFLDTEKSNKHITSFYVTESKNPYTDLKSVVPLIENLLNGFPSSMGYLPEKDKRIWVIKMLQNIFKATPNLFIKKKSYTSIEISNYETIYLVLKKKKSKSNNNRSFQRLKYIGLFKASDLLRKDLLTRLQLHFLSPFHLLDKNLTSIPVINKPIYSFLFGNSLFLEITSPEPNSYYLVATHYYPYSGETQEIYKGWLSQSLITFGKTIDDTGTQKIVMKLKIPPQNFDKKNDNQERGHKYYTFLLSKSLIKSKGFYEQCYIAQKVSRSQSRKNLAGPLFTYFKLTITQQLALYYQEWNFNQLTPPKADQPISIIHDLENSIQFAYQNNLLSNINLKSTIHLPIILNSNTSVPYCIGAFSYNFAALHSLPLPMLPFNSVNSQNNSLLPSNSIPNKSSIVSIPSYLNSIPTIKSLLQSEENKSIDQYHSDGSENIAAANSLYSAYSAINLQLSLIGQSLSNSNVEALEKEHSKKTSTKETKIA